MINKNEPKDSKPIIIRQCNPPQSRLKTDEVILPLVIFLKDKLKKGLLTTVIISDLVKITTKILSEQNKIIEKLKEDNLKILKEKELIVKALQENKKTVSPPEKELKGKGQIAKTSEMATAKSMRVSISINPSSIPHMDTIGKKLAQLSIKIQKTSIPIILTSKSYRKAIAAIDTHGADNCIITLQGQMTSIGKIEQAGIEVRIKEPPQNSTNESDIPEPES